MFARLAVLNACSMSSTSSGLSSTSKMSARWSGMRGGAFRCKVKSRAAIHRCFGPDTTAMALNDALHDRQADAGAGEILGAMQPLKHVEQLAGILHVEADPVVGDEEHLFVSHLARADLDAGVVAQFRVLEGVVDDVHEHLLEQRRIAP